MARRRGLIIALLASEILGGCGGGSGESSTNPSANPPAADATKVATAVDSSLQGTGALALVSSLSLVEKQPVGSPISAQVGAVVYALDAAGNAALAGFVVDGKVVYSAASTVLAMGATVMQGLVPSVSLDQLQANVKGADGYEALVGAVRSAVLAGNNPLDQISVQQGFDVVLSSAARAAVQASSTEPKTVHTLAVAPKHAPDTYEPTVFETVSYKVSIANSSSGESTFASRVYLRNTSAVFFRVALLDPTGAQMGAETLDGAGASLFSLTGALPTKVDKTLPGPFSIQLSVDDDKNRAALLKGVMSLVKPVSSDCINAAFKIANDKAADAGLAKAPLDQWTKFAIAQAVWKTVNACAVPDLTSTALSELFSTFSKITKLVGIGRLTLDRNLIPAVIPDTGVCLTEGQVLMSCVAQITANPISPMMPSAVQPINVLMLDEAGKKTLAPPFGLKIEYSDPNLFELSSTMTSVNSNLNNVEGSGTFKITDPATDKTISMSVTVTNGKLEKTSYTVPSNGTVDVKLVDPASGSEVYRGATFDIYLADGRFGSFTPITRGLGALTFHASSIATPTPQPIRVNGPKDSGSTMTVVGLPQQFLTGSSTCTYDVIPCGSGYGCHHWKWSYSWLAQVSVGSSLSAQGIESCGGWSTTGPESTKTCKRTADQPEVSTISGSGEYSYYSGGEAPIAVNGSIFRADSNSLITTGRLALICTYTR